MKTFLIGLLFFISICKVSGQNSYADSLKLSFSSVEADSSKINTLILLSSYYSGLYPDSGVYYADKIIELSTKNNYVYGQALGLIYKVQAITKQGDFTTAIQLAYKCLNLSKGLHEHRLIMLSRSYQLIGEINAVSGHPVAAEQYLFKSIDLQKQSGEFSNDSYKIFFTLAFTMLIQDKKDSAMIYLNKAWEIFSTAEKSRLVEPWIVSGNVHKFSGDPQKAESYFREGIQKGKEHNTLFFVAAISNDLAGLFYDKGMRDSCLHYLHQCLFLSQKYQYKVFEMSASEFLYYLYDPVNRDSTLKYMKIFVTAKNEVFGDEKIKQFQAASFDEEKKENELEQEKTKYENKIKLYSTIGTASVFLMISFILYRNNRQKQHANHLLGLQKEKIERTLNELKMTQAQLIQSEKMASLGELTAGIAHEIQNPLNFVNNFASINAELIDEMRQELAIGNSQLAIDLAKDIKENEEKIMHHGKRAESIVKGMLQHSRTSTGTKEPTDINALADEYMRLSYHGLRAKDKSFMQSFPEGMPMAKMDLDPTLPLVNVIPQDIGRVLLNLFNNAFWAVNEKLKTEGVFPDGSLHDKTPPVLSLYQPVVTLATKNLTDHIEIRIRDNGPGIPQHNINKIFQPFFTTKPTGQGTGLGLSLAYDIIKAHGGSITVNTSETAGTEFVIQLSVI